MDPISWFVSHYTWDKAKKLLKEKGLFDTDLHERTVEQAFNEVRKENKKLHVPLDIMGDAWVMKLLI